MPPTATATSRPEPAGRVLYYQKGYRQQTLVAYDVDARAVWWSRPLVPITGNQFPFFKATLAGTEIAVSDGKVVRMITLDGSSERMLLQVTDDSERFAFVAGSPDGSYLAVTASLAPERLGTPSPDGAYAQRVRSALLIVDAASGQIVLRIDSDRPELRNFAGEMHWLLWRDDSKGVVVSGSTLSEKPGGAATIYLDGSVTLHAIRGYLYLAPDGRSIAHGPLTFGCMVVAGHDISIIDTDRRTDVVRYANLSEAMAGIQWSPDSKENLFASWPYDAQLECGFDPKVPEELRLLNVSTGAIQSMSDRRALFQRWYGDELIELEGCGLEDGPLRTSRWQYQIATCLPGGAIGFGAFKLDGAEIDRSDFFEVVGWLRR